MTKSNRIWELDALRGVMILCVVFIHLCFDLDYFLGIDVVKNPVLQYCMDHFGMTFVMLSGVSATGTEIGVLVVGCIVSFVVSLLVIKGLMEYVRKHSFSAFGVYRIILGIVVLAYFAIFD